MGTNYYWHEAPCEKPCSHCTQKGTHIGKSSYGWVFSLHVGWKDYGDPAPMSLAEWKKKFNEPDSYIVDEYNTLVSIEKMLSIITNRSYEPKNPFLHDAWSEPGPRGLLRSTIKRNCIGHGDPEDDFDTQESSTWERVVGEFS